MKCVIPKRVLSKLATVNNRYRYLIEIQTLTGNKPRSIGDVYGLMSIKNDSIDHDGLFEFIRILHEVTATKECPLGPYNLRDNR